MSNYIAKNGTVITKEMLARWVKDAENNHQDPSLEVTYVEDFQLKKEPMVNKTYRLPKSLILQLETKAEEAGITPSDLVRKTLRKSLAS